MKFYEVHMAFFDSNRRLQYYAKGTTFKDIKVIAEKIGKVYYIEGFNKDKSRFYREFYDSSYIYRIYNKNKECIYLKELKKDTYYLLRIQYPAGEVKYKKYMNQLKKEKLEKILKS